MLTPGATIGILGGGQLARMLALAAAPLGLKAHIYAPEPDSPAFDVAAAHTIATYDDEAALAAFAKAVDVVTYEFENVPAATAALVARHAPLRPGAAALAVAQDRLAEKTFLRKRGIPTADFAPIESVADLTDALARIGQPCVLKTRRLGYDGKGQVVIRDGDDPATAFAAIHGQPAILEAFVPFACEVSAVIARGLDGSVAPFDVTRNEHRGGILRLSQAPAGVPDTVAQAAIAAATSLTEALDYIGVLAVEFFVVGDSAEARLVANEIAPRVHNSGHWTIEGATTSQFEQHIRAIAGWPLGLTTRRAPRVTMTNLIGTDAGDWPALAAEPGAHLHLYGKGEMREGRKMGHVTRLMDI